MENKGDDAVEIIAEVELLGEKPTLMDIWRLLKSNSTGINIDLRQHKEEINSKFAIVDKQVAENQKMIAALQDGMKRLESATLDATFDRELEKQRNLRNNVTVMGIPATKNENLKAVVVKVFACIDVVVAVSNVQNVYRKNNIIIVKLANYDIEAKIIENKTKKKILLSNVYPSVSNEVQIFVNNHTTPYFGRILQFGRNAVRDKKIVSIRLASKGCLLKFTSDGDEFLVKSVSHFIEIMDLQSNVATNQTTDDSVEIVPEENASTSKSCIPVNSNNKIIGNNKNKNNINSGKVNSLRKDSNDKSGNKAHSSKRRNRSFDKGSGIEKENPKSKPKTSLETDVTDMHQS